MSEAEKKSIDGEDKFRVGRVFEAKKPKTNGFYCDDRQIVWRGINQVQYDSPRLKTGARLPIVSLENFEKWAGRDVTDLMPEGDWRLR